MTHWYNSQHIDAVFAHCTLIALYPIVIESFIILINIAFQAVRLCYKPVVIIKFCDSIVDIDFICR